MIMLSRFRYSKNLGKGVTDFPVNAEFEESGYGACHTKAGDESIGREGQHSRISSVIREASAVYSIHRTSPFENSIFIRYKRKAGMQGA